MSPCHGMTFDADVRRWSEKKCTSSSSDDPVEHLETHVCRGQGQGQGGVRLPFLQFGLLRYYIIIDKRTMSDFGRKAFSSFPYQVGRNQKDRGVNHTLQLLPSRS